MTTRSGRKKSFADVLLPGLKFCSRPMLKGKANSLTEVRESSACNEEVEKGKEGSSSELIYCLSL